MPKRASFIIAAIALIPGLAPAPATAQPQGPGAVDIPVAGPPPPGDFLPEPEATQRSRAGLQMTATVVAGLALVFLLLRLAARRASHATAPNAVSSPTAELVDKATRALEEVAARERGRDKDA